MTGVEGAAPSASPKDHARRQAEALSELSVTDAEKRLVLDWTQPLRHATFYEAVYRPAVLRANKTTPAAKPDTNSRSTRCGTRTRACASQRASGPSTSRS